MGLDNTILLENVRKTDLPDYIYPDFVYSDGAIGLVYFHEFWGARNEIIYFLLHSDNSKSRIRLDKEDILPIVYILTSYLNKEYYEVYADSKWKYDDYTNRITNAVIKLVWLRSYMEEHPNIECYFTDLYSD